MPPRSLLATARRTAPSAPRPMRARIAGAIAASDDLRAYLESSRHLAAK
jgi:hypothetical protein